MIKTEQNLLQNEPLTKTTLRGSFKDTVLLIEYYQKIVDTHQGGCRSQSQVDTIRKVEVLKSKIDDISDSYC